jgi:hypothetical protein
MTQNRSISNKEKDATLRLADPCIPAPENPPFYSGKTPAATECLPPFLCVQNFSRPLTFDFQTFDSLPAEEKHKKQMRRPAGRHIFPIAG